VRLSEKLIVETGVMCVELIKLDTHDIPNSKQQNPPSIVMIIKELRRVLGSRIELIRSTKTLIGKIIIDRQPF
jgi:hypothetical protein